MEIIYNILVVLLAIGTTTVIGVILIAGFRDGIWPSFGKDVSYNYKDDYIEEFYTNDEIDTFTEFIYRGNTNITREFFKHDGNYGYIIRADGQEKVNCWVYCGVTNTVWQYKKKMKIMYRDILDCRSDMFWLNKGVRRISMEEYFLSVKTVTKDNSRKDRLTKLIDKFK
jgi:hypothetical protein